MRKSKFRIAAVVCLTALAASNLLGQTWINPNNGSWTISANWVGGAAPVSSNSTHLTFNAIAAQSYSATNDFAGTFTLSRLTLNSAGASTR